MPKKEVLHRIEVKHRTCGTKKRYISPAYELSYDVDLKLHDDHNNKDYHQIHDDGTTVIYREVFVHEKSFYNNPQKGVKERIEKLIQDMYIANGKQNNQRMFAYGEISVLNNLSDKELIELTNRIGEYLTTTYKRPVVLGLHKKRGNNHIHFNIAERELRKGRFLLKRKKIYKDRNGKLILDKNYYDEKGWDNIRLEGCDYGDFKVISVSDRQYEFFLWNDVVCEKLDGLDSFVPCIGIWKDVPASYYVLQYLKRKDGDCARSDFFGIIFSSKAKTR